MAKIITVLGFFLFFFLQQGQAQPFTQLGSDIDAETAGDLAGSETKLSGDGQRLIVGAPKNQGARMDSLKAGHARVFEWDGTNWVQMGNDLDGVNTLFFGFEVNISDDGNRVVVGAYEVDIVRVFEWDGTDWVQMGVDITSGAASNDDWFGFSLDMAENGNKIIVGAPGHINGFKDGYAKIYEWDGTTWVQVGNTITGNNREKLGFAVSISEDANYVITGSIDGGANRVGHVQVYQYNNMNWTQVGNNINGDPTFGNHFGYTVDIADHGHVIVVGDNTYGNNVVGSGQAYCWNGTSWQPRGALKTGNSYLYGMGSSVELSSDGNIMVLGAGDAFNTTGQTHTYTWNGSSWDARPLIYGETGGDRSGRSTGLAVMGGNMHLAIGGNFNQGTGFQAGHVRVFEGCAPVYIIDSINVCDTAYTWTAGNGLTYTSSTELCSAPFHVQGTNLAGCDTFRILILTLNPLNSFTPTISIVGDTVTITAVIGATYQWIDCSTNTPIVGAIDSIFAPGSTGTYAVRVTWNGCVYTSPCVRFVGSSVLLSNSTAIASTENNIQLYPNPTNGHFTISMEESQEQVQIRLMDVSGRVLQEQYYEQFLQEEWSLEASAPAGMYIVSVQVGTQAPVHLKLIKR